VNKDGVKEYIQKTAGGVQQDLLFKRIIIYQQNPLPEAISIKDVIAKLEDRVPRFLCTDIDSIFVGSFDFLKEREIEAVYENGAIFITNEQEDIDDFLADIVHEIAHSVEEIYPSDIYDDQSIEEEFLAKRRSMAEILKAHGYGKFDMGVFFDTEYSEEFDNYLYKEVGYELLHTLLEGLFVSPYGATSLREYFANCFEEFFAGDSYYVRSISPRTYNKIISLQGY